MSDAKHTKGPWIVGTMGHDTDIDTQVSCLKENEGTDKEWTAIGVEDADGFSEVIALAHPANARLIAAAPDLLEALGGLFEQCAMVHKHWGENSNTKQADDAIAFAQAAIAKAEGR